MAATESMDGTRNAASQAESGGMFVRKTTRLAGFEMGSTKDAALAMRAQAKRCGRG